MGVTGLWQILQSTGRPVTLESLDGKVLAVDVSIWLNQLVKGMRDRHGNPVPNAHLVGLYSRVCKLLFYKIKPVFVFDGGVPILKKQTLASRKQRKEEAAESSKKATEKILLNVIRQQAIKKSLPALATDEIKYQPAASSSGHDDMFILPPSSSTKNTDKNEEESEDIDIWEERMHERQKIYSEFQDIENVDIESEEFKQMPPEIRHEILTELKAHRKENHWADLDDLPEDSNDFSNYQVAKLLKQNKLSMQLDNVSKEINSQQAGGISGLPGSYSDVVEVQRVVSEDSSHYVLIKGLSEQKKSSLYDTIVKREKSPSNNVKSNGLKKVGSSADIGNWMREDFSTVIGSQSNSDRRNIFIVNGSPEYKPDIVSNTQDLSSQKNDYIDEPQPSTSKGNGYIDEGKLSSTVPDSFDSKTDVPIVICSSDDESDILITDINQLKKMKEIFTSKKIKSENLYLTKDYLENGTSSQENSLSAKTEKAVFFDSDSGEEMHYDSQMNTAIEINYSQEGGFCKEESPENTPRTQNITAEEVSRHHDKMTIKEEITEDNAQHVQINGTQDGLICNDKSLDEQIGVKFSTQEPNALVNNGLQWKTELPSKNKPTASSSDEESSDNDFIEIRIDPKNIKPDDEFFPASMFITTSDSENPSTLTRNGVDPDNQPSVEQPIIDEVTDGDFEDEPMNVTENHGEPRENEFAGLTQEDLQHIQSDLQDERCDLEKERGRQERMARTITDQMYTEAQELLSLFGIPFIISPMEAEAQCAFLDATNQIEGTITDDSDIWLFGGKRVYKNFFNQNREVEFFRKEDIQSKLGLQRKELIDIALLCGSDYTSGLQGVGPISALEILAEFKGKDPLINFREWWDRSQKQTKIPHETKVKSKLRKLQLTPGFPSPAVVEAYMEPCVDEARDSFSWGKPDVNSIRQYAIDKFGWVKTKTDETLLPVMKQLESAQHQTSIKKYFLTQPTEKRSVKSKRMQRALDQFHHKTDPAPPEPKLSNEELKARAKTVLDNAKNKAVKVLSAEKTMRNKPQPRCGKRSKNTAAGFVRASCHKLPQEVNLSESSSSDSSDCDTQDQSELKFMKQKYESANLKAKGQNPGLTSKKVNQRTVKRKMKK